MFRRISPVTLHVTQRFFASEPIVSSQVLLCGQEAKHLAQVMRASPGMEVILFDGSGAEFLAQVVAIKRREVLLEVKARQQPQRELEFEIVIAAAVPKGDRLRWMVEKLTELGVARFVPLVTARGVVTPRSAVLERLRQVVIEASKQCGRNRLMQIAPLTSWAEMLDQFTTPPDCYFGDPAGIPFPALNLSHAGAARRDGSGGELGVTRVVLAIGPEGGLTADEVAQSRAAGWTATSLGPRILRIETAAVAWSAVVALG